MKPLRIIAECAQGYEGQPTLGELLIKAAAAAQADAVKFQIVFADDVAVRGYRYYDWYKRVEMPVEAWLKLRNAARERGLEFYSDISGERALAVARQLSLDAAKIHAGNFFNHRLVEQVLESFPRTLVSMGGIAVEEVEQFITRHRLTPGEGRVAFLFGFQAEPTPVESNRLARLPHLQARLSGFEVGFMDHSDGGGPDPVGISLMAQALGVRLFEKHLTLDRELRINDYTSALGPGAFGDYVATLRRLDAALGEPSLTLSEAEYVYRRRMLKKLLTVSDLPAGHVLSQADLLPRRIDVEGTDFCCDADRVIGRRLARAVAAEQPLTEADLA
jgi:N,N'-diacetyllegionaminate synthase